MEPIVKQIHKSLLKKQRTIAVAESCTGGELSSLLTSLSGSSRYFILGVVVYSNASKKDILGIPASVINRNGAVSELVAKNMAESIRKIAKTDLGVGVTGIAGPTGGTPRKPKGTIFIAIDSKNKKVCKEFLFTGSRSQIREKAAKKSLELLKAFIAELIH